MTWVFIVIGLCIFFEALFSGGEIALLSADKVKLRHIAEEMPARRSKIIHSFLDNPGVLITTSLIGTNLCVVLSSVVATLTFLRHYPEQAELFSLALVTPLVLVFGEILPKSIFQEYADFFVTKVVYSLWIFRLMVFPFVAAGTWLSNRLIKILPIERDKPVMSREELGLLLRLPSREGEDKITAEEKQMVTRIFDFKEHTVEDLMLPLSEVTALSVTATLDDVAQEIAEKGHTRIPIFEERLDQIVGIIHAYDVLRAETGAELKDICRPAIFVPESQPAVDTLVRLQREGQGMAVVVDEYGGATGVITIEDILEEIVGEIEDEYDDTGPELFFKEGEGAYRVVAKAPVDRINEQLKLNLPLSEEYESLAGLILDLFKRIPEVNEEITIGRVSLTITKATERSVEEVLIKPTRKKPPTKYS